MNNYRLLLTLSLLFSLIKGADAIAQGFVVDSMKYGLRPSSNEENGQNQPLRQGLQQTANLQPMVGPGPHQADLRA